MATVVDVMRCAIALLLAIPLLLSAVCVHAGTPQEKHHTGLLVEEPDTAHEIAYIPPASPDVDVRAGNISAVFNLEGLPPVKSQGSQNSCTAWAVAYYHRTHLEWREKHWDVNLSEHQCSPAFLYNHINGGLDTGSYYTDAMEMLMTMGCATMKDFPYDQNDYYSWPSSPAIYMHALEFRVANYHTISLADDSGIINLKQHIANGGTAVIGIWVYSNFDNIGAYNNTYCVSEISGLPSGAHSVTVYGFDDNFTTSDGTGAFRLVNSWGTGWGDNGHFWMSYAAVKSMRTSLRTAYFLVDRENYTPELIMELGIEHNVRGEVMWNGIQAGIGTAENPAYYLELFNFDFIQSVVPLSLYQRHPFPDCTIPLDLTDGMAQIVQGNNTLFVKLTDAASSANTGTVNFCGATHIPWNLTNFSGDVPAVIPENGTYLVAYVHLDYLPLYPEISIMPAVICPSERATVALKVHDMNGNCIENASVKMHADIGTLADAWGLTNSTGEFSTSFISDGIAGSAIVNVSCTVSKPGFAQGTCQGSITVLSSNITFSHQNLSWVYAPTDLELYVNISSAWDILAVTLHYLPPQNDTWVHVTCYLVAGNLTDGTYLGRIRNINTSGTLVYYFTATDTKNYSANSENYIVDVLEPVTSSFSIVSCLAVCIFVLLRKVFTSLRACRDNCG